MADRKRTTRKQPRPQPRDGRIVFTLLTLAGALVAAFALYYAFRGGSGKPASGEAVTLYFVNAQTKRWETESRQIPNGTEMDVLRFTLKEWVLGPKADTLMPAVPPGVVPEATLGEDGYVEISFPETYGLMTPQEAAICNSSLVYTLTSLPFITDVQITVNDAPLAKANGKPVGALTQDAIVLDSNDVTNDAAETRALTLYFPDADGMYLHAETREIAMDPNQPVEKYIVEQLIKGPARSGLYPAIPADARLRSVKTEEGGKCYVDFTDDFIKKFDGGSTAELFLVYAIVDSLTELPGVKEVQLLFNGEIALDVPGFGMDLSKPFTRNDALLAD